MLDLPKLNIRIESAVSPEALALIEQSESEVTAADRAAASAESLSAPNTEFIVARLDNRPVGYIALVDRVRYGEMRRLYVSPEARGHGVGAALVNALEAAARDIGLRRVLIEAEPDRPKGRERFARLGFRGLSDATDAWMEKAL